MKDGWVLIIGEAGFIIIALALIFHPEQDGTALTATIAGLVGLIGAYIGAKATKGGV